MRVLVAGEALVDVQLTATGSAAPARVGGSPLNVAVALARLGVPTGFSSVVSTDRLGERILEHLVESGVDPRYVRRSRAPTMQAEVRREAGRESYEFRFRGRAGTGIERGDLPSELPEDVRAIHFGSIALLLQPTARSIVAFVKRQGRRRLVSLDPNVRPALIRSIPTYRRRLERWIRSSDLVKVSRDDLEAVYGDAPSETVVRRWLRRRPSLVVVTRGGDGAVGWTARTRADVPAVTVEVKDTVGAGDAFTAGLLARLDEREALSAAALADLDEGALRDALRFAALAAARTCEKEGADPPRRSDLRSDETPPAAGP